MMAQRHTLFLIIAATLFSAAGIFNLFQFTSQQEIDVSSYIHRFEGVKEVVEPYSVVGYLYRGDIDIRNYYLTQYAMAPLVVANNPNMPLVIGNFGKVTPRFLKNIIHPRYRIIKDFGNGVMLLKKK